MLHSKVRIWFVEGAGVVPRRRIGVRFAGGDQRSERLEEFVGGGRLVGPDAAFPFNTSGGNIGEAYIHGFEMVNESVRQIRGTSTCQVKKVERALVVAGPGYAPGSAALFGAAS